MSEIRVCIVVFILGVCVGFLLKTVFVRKLAYSGTILVSHENKKTVYSLVLDDYPEKLEFKKEVVFKVDATPENFNRN